MTNRIRSYLELIRFPNLFTAMADVLAGYLIVRATAIEWIDVGSLVLASCCIYAGGCALNDFHDRHLDARERPLRPIPSGRTTAGEALFLSCLLFAGGIGAAFAAGRVSGMTALILVFLVALYDLTLKARDLWGPVNMAACRVLNLLLGMSVAFYPLGLPALFPVLTFGYVFALTILSLFEVEGGLGSRGAVIFAGPLLVLFVMVLLTAAGRLNKGSLAYLAVWVVISGLPLILAAVRPSPAKVGRAVKYLILGIPLLDAAYVSGIHSWTYGLPVALCILPAVLLARMFYVT